MSFRSILFSVLFSLTFVDAASSQELKFISPTSKKTVEGAAPIASIKYDACFKKKKNQDVHIDSVKSVSDGKMLSFSLFKKGDIQKHTDLNLSEKGSFRLHFEVIQILSEERLPYTDDNRPVQYDLSKGVCIYYTLAGNRKTAIINNFKELPGEAHP